MIETDLDADRQLAAHRIPPGIRRAGVMPADLGLGLRTCGVRCPRWCVILILAGLAVATLATVLAAVLGPGRRFPAIAFLPPARGRARRHAAQALGAAQLPRAGLYTRSSGEIRPGDPAVLHRAQLRRQALRPRPALARVSRPGLQGGQGVRTG
ncbi:hypothetical protein QJS66_09205 [Kocuria rhizophila]|nr:hypothetical protein QJS66_09205 [Kocuria rhizophila]